MSFFRSRPTNSVIHQLGLLPSDSTIYNQNVDINNLQSQITSLQKQLDKQLQINQQLSKELELLSLVRDDALRLSALKQFITSFIDTSESGKLSSNELSVEFMTWALAEKGIMVSDDETKALMRKLFNIPKDQSSKFPYRGHNNQYFYKGFSWKTSNITTQSSHPSPSQSPSQSPSYSISTSPPPIVSGH